MQLQRLLGNVLRREPEMATCICLVPSLVQESVRCSYTKKSSFLRRLVRYPLGHAATEPSKYAMLFDGNDYRESGESFGEQIFVQRLDRVKAHYLR